MRVTGESAVTGGGESSFVGSGGASLRDCSRFPGVIQELWEDLPYSIPFFCNVSSEIVFLVVMERKRW